MKKKLRKLFGQIARGELTTIQGRKLASALASAGATRQSGHSGKVTYTFAKVSVFVTEGGTINLNAKNISDYKGIANAILAAEH